MQNRLTIRIGHGTLSFSAADENGDIRYYPYEVKGGISMSANLREAFRSVEWYAKGWERALVMLDSPVMMLPVEEFAEDKCASLYNYTFTVGGNDAVLHTVLPSQNAVAVFAVNKDLKLVIEDRFSDVKIMHLCTPVWSYLHRRSFIGSCQKLYGYFHDRRLEVFSYQQNRFKFCNSFPVKHSGDSVYFLLYVWKMLGLDQRRDELHLIGDIDGEGAVLADLRRFVRNVYTINPAGDFNRAAATLVPGLPYDLVALYVKGY